MAVVLKGEAPVVKPPVEFWLENKKDGTGIKLCGRGANGKKYAVAHIDDSGIHLRPDNAGLGLPVDGCDGSVVVD